MNTLSEKDRENIRKIFLSLSKKSGSRSILSSEINIGLSAISQIINGIFLPSAKLCCIIEKKFGISKEKIRPDIFLN